jgi:hypothetical protein
MRDTDATADRGGPEEPRMTLLAVNNSYWLYEGEDLLHDMLFGRGAYPFRVRCVMFKNAIEVRQILGEGFEIGSLWNINAEIVDRLRRENLLVEVLPTDD